MGHVKGLMRQAGAILSLCLTLLSTPLHAQDQQATTWQTALELSQSGANAQALPLLEKLVSEAPKNKHFRFELALALFRLEKDIRARFHLERLLGAKLTAAERGMVLRVIATIDARRVWSAYFSFNLKPETNGTRQTQGSELVLGGYALTLDDEAIGKATTSAIVTTGFTYAPKITDRVKAQLSLGAYLKHSSEESLRDYQLTARAGLSFTPDALRQWGGGVSVATRHAGGAHYSDTFGFYGDHARRIGAAGTLRFGAQVTRAWGRNGAADIDRSFVHASYTYAIGGNASVTAGGFHEDNASKRRHLDGQRTGISLSGTYVFKGGLSTSLTLRGEMDNRTGINQVFGVARQDRKLAAELTVHHRDFRIGSFAPQIQFGIERNRSNIPLADFTNRSVSFSLTRRF